MEPMTSHQVCPTNNYPFADKDAYLNRLHKGEMTFAGLTYELDDDRTLYLFVTPETPQEQIDKATDEAFEARSQIDFQNLVILNVRPEWIKEQEFTPKSEDKELISESQQNWLDAVKWITENKQYRRVDRKTGQLVPDNKRGGVMVDLFSASTLLSVYKILSKDGQNKMLSFQIDKAISIAFKLLK